LGYGAGLIMQILLLVQGRVRIGLHWRHLRPELPLMKRIMAVALPSTL
jgi:Na+-driven multidrug efflux pump